MQLTPTLYHSQRLTSFCSPTFAHLKYKLFNRRQLLASALRMASERTFPFLIMSTIFIFISVCPYLVFNQLTSNDGDDLLMLNKLRVQLLRVQRYNKNARPVIRHSTVTNVTFTMFIRRFLELNHKESSLKTYATIYCVSTVP